MLLYDCMLEQHVTEEIPGLLNQNLNCALKLYAVVTTSSPNSQPMIIRTELQCSIIQNRKSPSFKRYESIWE